MRILCATDLLSKSEAAIDRAGILADHLDAELTLLHVVVPGGSQLALEQTLQWASAEMLSRSRPPRWHGERIPHFSVQAGSASTGILDTANQLQARLLVLGPHRRRPLRDALEGTIAEKALAAGNRAVLVVRRAAPRPYRHVLLALDTSDSSASAIRAAESLVLTPDVEATVVHAYRPPYEGLLYSADVGIDTVARYSENWKREATRSVRELLSLESDDATRYAVHIEQKPEAPGILRAIAHFSPDLLVMGTRGGNRLRRTFAGSVANRVLHETACDVLIVPDGSFGAARSRQVFGGSRRARHPERTADHERSPGR